MGDLAGPAAALSDLSAGAGEGAHAPVISGTTFVYLSACDWSAPWHGPQEIAVRLGAAGNRVVYVETLGWRRPRSFDLPRIGARLARAAGARLRSQGTIVAPGVERLSPLLLPGASSRPAHALNRQLLLRLLRPRLAGRHGQLVLWIYTPSRLALDLVGALGEDLAVYHCTQAYAHRPLAPPDTSEVEERLIERVGAVVVDGIALYEERRVRHPYVYRVPTGVNAGDYSGASPPRWAAGLRRPVIGYLGTVDHRVDPTLLAAVARARPESSVLLVGPVVDADVGGLAALPNVVLHGHVPIDEVPSVLAAFDVGVLPYAEHAMTRYTYPAKLHQYLAAGLPIASTPLPDLTEFEHLVEVGRGPAGFARAVERALASPRREPERRAVAARNTWEARLGALSAIVSGHLSGAPPPPSRDFRP